MPNLSSKDGILTRHGAPQAFCCARAQGRHRVPDPYLEGPESSPRADLRYRGLQCDVSPPGCSPGQGRRRQDLQSRHHLDKKHYNQVNAIGHEINLPVVTTGENLNGRTVPAEV